MFTALLLAGTLSVNGFYALPQTMEEQAEMNMRYEIHQIDYLKDGHKKKYLEEYKNIISKYSFYFDLDETIYDATTDEEFYLLSHIVEAEIGNGNFDQKVNVSNTIINRYFDENFPNNFYDILTQQDYGVSQYSTYGNESYKKVEPSDDTIKAIEYAYMFEDTTDGALYFHSGESEWHKNNLNFLFDDGKHKFYK